MYDYKKEAKDLLEWSEKEDSLTLYEFTYHKPYLEQDLTDFAKREPDFALALNKAKERISKNRERSCNKGKMRDCVWNRTAGLYSKRLRDYEREEKEHEIKCKVKYQVEAGLLNSETPNKSELDLKDRLYKALNTIEEMQKEINDLKPKTSPELQPSDAQIQSVDRGGELGEDVRQS